METNAEKITTAISLFRELEYLALVEPGKYDFLNEVLETVGRFDLSRLLSFMTSQVKIIFGKKSVPEPTDNKRALLVRLTGQLRKSDVKKMAFMCGIHVEDGLDLVQDLEHKGLISLDNFSFLENCLGAIGRQDLGQMLLMVKKKPPMVTSSKTGKTRRS